MVQVASDFFFLAETSKPKMVEVVTMLYGSLFKNPLHIALSILHTCKCACTRTLMTISEIAISYARVLLRFVVTFIFNFVYYG